MRLVIVATAAALAGSTLAACSSHVKEPRALVASSAPTGHTAPQTAPIYPGAMPKARGKVANVVTYVAKVPFGRVYAWYGNVLPPGAEKSHSLTPPQTATFVTGDPGDQQTISLSAEGKSTIVVIALRRI